MAAAKTKGNRQAVAGTGGDQSNDSAPVAGSLFGVPMYSTQRRLIPDNGNGSLAVTPAGGQQTNVPTTKLDQLDIVQGIKIPFTYTGKWTHGSGKALHASPFFPGNIFKQITFKLQAAYNTFNLPGPLAAAMQAYRPMWGNRGLGSVTPDVFASFSGALPTDGVDDVIVGNIDIPFAIKFDEYFDLTAQGAPAAKLYDAIVSPMFMAAQARVVTPTITIAPQLGLNDLLGSPVSLVTGDTTSAYADGALALGLYRDAFWTSNNIQGNPPQFAWLYTRDFYTQPTSGQSTVQVLIQNTGTSVGQVMSLCFFTWDPAANSGLGAPVPWADVTTIEVVTGGSLQNLEITPQIMHDRMRSLYGATVADDLFDAGIGVWDWALCEDGGYLSNAECINTYVVNGVSLNLTYLQGSVPGALSTVYMGVEALKLATS